jgi:hypothetical protein
MLDVGCWIWTVGQAMFCLPCLNMVGEGTIGCLESSLAVPEFHLH